MKNKSEIEEIIETSIKYPVVGIIFSLFFAGLGFYLTNKHVSGAKPAEMVFSPMFQMFGKVSYILSAILLICTVIGFIVISIKRKNQMSFYGLRRTLDDLKNLSWKEFEEFVATLFIKMGYSIEVTGGLHDGGIDLVVKKDGITSLVQCKNYRVSKVTLSAVRDFYGAMNANLNFEAGYFITTGIFTLEARHFAENKPIELIDGARLMDYINMTSSKDLSHIRSFSNSATSNIPVCSRCGADMVLRTARKGNNVGSQFWGCSTYPKCNETKSVGS